MKTTLIHKQISRQQVKSSGQRLYCGVGTYTLETKDEDTASRMFTGHEILNIGIGSTHIVNIIDMVVGTRLHTYFLHGNTELYEYLHENKDNLYTLRDEQMSYADMALPLSEDMANLLIERVVSCTGHMLEAENEEYEEGSDAMVYYEQQIVNLRKQLSEIPVKVTACHHCGTAIAGSLDMVGGQCKRCYDNLPTPLLDDLI